MLFGLNVPIVLALIISALLVLTVAVQVVAIYFKGSSGGWDHLADYFGTSPTPRGDILQNQSIVAGRVPYLNCVTVGLGDEGLYLSVARPLTRPLFIPWTEFRIIEDVRFLGYAGILVSLRNPIVGTITVPTGLFQMCRPYLPNLKRKSRRSSGHHWSKCPTDDGDSHRIPNDSTDRPSGGVMEMRQYGS
jgi:hypothetical protein